METDDEVPWSVLGAVLLALVVIVAGAITGLWLAGRFAGVW